MGNYNVTMSFNADTSKARQQLEQLQQTLTKLGQPSSSVTNSLNITKDIQEASTAALQLKAHLEQATNVKTGNIDFTKFNNSLKQSGTDLGKLSSQLLTLGTEGRQAFLQLTNSVLAAEIPLKRTSKLLSDFKTTLANTVKWQVSSSIMHGMMGAMQSAYGYAQDLNESLTNIRIVTGQSTEQMAAFAEKANAAAKSLSTTTTAYTDAALIFYQQGLGDKDVQARTEATIKMAQATGDSATEVSSYMTAIWNNFDNGSESMEHYADVITALGASTASSSSEIAEGLSKFAAIANTTGLSYEYATASLATLVAETRQSADTVGNSLKTIFSRLQGLSLGDTLEDGTTLNKYSTALEKVGVSIKDSNGNLKDMDNILDELGSKWQELEQDQKMALAQTVAGTRQYSVLISMMDNWDKVQKNITTANNSDGTLSKQAKIYQESWEAASKRVRAALEHLYTTLLDDKFFIKLTDAIAKVVSGIDKIISSAGGLKTLIPIMGAIFSDKIASGVSNAAYGLMMMTKGGQQAVQDERNKQLDSLATNFQEANSSMDSSVSEAMTMAFKDQVSLQQKYIQNADKYNAIEKQVLTSKIAQTKEISDSLVKQKELENLQKNNALRRANKFSNQKEAQQYALFRSSSSAISQLNSQMIDAYEDKMDAESITQIGTSIAKSIRHNFVTVIDGLSDDAKKEVEEVLTALENLSTDTNFEGLQDKLRNALFGGENGISADFENIDLDNPDGEEFKKKLDALGLSMVKVGEKTVIYKKAVDDAGESVNNATPKIATLEEKIQTSTQAVMSCSAAISAISSVVESIVNGDWKSVLAALPGLLTTVTMAVTALNAMSAKLYGTEAAGILIESKAAAAKTAYAAATTVAEKAQAGLNLALSINPIIAVVTAITALVVIYKAVTVAAEKASKAVIEANNAYTEQKEKVESLESEIESLNNQIDELLSKGKLSIVEQSELEKLQTESSLLQQQLEVERELEQIRLKKAADTYYSNYQKYKNNPNHNLTTPTVSYEDETGNPVEVNVSSPEEVSNLESMVQNARSELNAFGDEIFEIAKNWDYLSDEAYNDSDLRERYKKYLASNKDLALYEEGFEGLNMVLNTASAGQGDRFTYLMTNLSNLENAWNSVAEAKEAAFEENYEDSYEKYQADVEGFGYWLDNNKATATAEDIAEQVEYLTERAKGIFGDRYEEIILGSRQNIIDANDKNAHSNGQLTSDEILSQYVLGSNDIQGAIQALTDSFSKETIESLQRSGINPEEMARIIVENYQKGLERAQEQVSRATERFGNKFTSWYDSLSDEDKEIFLTLNLDDFENLYQIKQKIRETNQYAKDNPIEVKYKAIKGAKDSFTEGMSLDGLQAWKNENNLKFSDDEWQQFLGGTYKQQSKIVDSKLKAAKDAYQADLRTTMARPADEDAEAAARDAAARAETAIATAENQKAALQAQKETLQANLRTVETTQDEINLLQENIEALSAEKTSSDDLLNAMKLTLQDDVDQLRQNGVSEEELAQFEQSAAEAVEWIMSQIGADEYKTKNGTVLNSLEEVFYQALGTLYSSENVSASTSTWDTFLDEILPKIYTNQNNDVTIAKLTETKDSISNGGEDSAIQTLSGEIAEIDAEISELETDIENNSEVRDAATDKVNEYQANREAAEQANLALRDLLEEQSYDTMDSLYDDLDSYSGNMDIFIEQLEKLAATYDNCTTELERFQNALEKGDADAITTAESALKLSIRCGELGKKTGIAADDIEAYAKQLKIMDKYAKATDELVAQDAVAILRFDRAVQSANKNLEDWKKELKEANGEALISTDTYEGLAQAYADALNIDADDLSAGFITSIDNANNLEKALTGDTEAYNDLKKAAFEDTLQFKYDIDTSEYDEKFSQLMAETVDGRTILDDILTMQANLDDQQVLDALSQMVSAITNDVTEAQRILGSMGVTAELEPVESTTTDEKVVTGFHYNTVSHSGPYMNPMTGEISNGTWYDLAPVIDTQTISTESQTMTNGIKVTSANYTSGGAGKATAAPTKAGGSKSNSGGGGGSQKTAKKNNQEKKDPREEKDRYHVVKNQIEDLTAAYDKVNKAKERAFGPEKIKHIDDEIKAQEKLIKKNEEYLSEIQKYKAEDAGIMAGSYGAIFDENGTITNYEQMLQEQVDKYNKAVEVFNTFDTDDENAKQAFDAATKAYEQFKKDLQKYEESQDLEKEQMQEIIDQKNKVHDLAIEQIEAAVDLKVKVSDNNLQYLQYALQNIENKAYDVAQAFGILNNETDEYTRKQAGYIKGLKDILSLAGASENDINAILDGSLSNNGAALTTISQLLSDGEGNGLTQSDIEKMQEYVQAIQSTNQEMEELRKTVHDQITTVWSKWSDQLDKGISKITSLQEITKSYGNIIDLVGKKNLGISNALMDQLGKTNMSQANNRVAAEKARYDALKQSYDEAAEAFESRRLQLSDEEVQQWEENLQTMSDDVASAASSFQSAWEDALTAVNEAFTASVERIMEAYSDGAAGLKGSISELQDSFDRQKSISDEYLSDYQKIYEFNKLNRDINKSIDETSNVRAKKELLAVQQKINKIEESGAEVSEYEMKQLRLEYELKKAMIEMEEAQNAKSKVQMRRDSEGNFAYVYTADGDEVAKAEQAYADKLYELQTLNQEYIDSLQSEMINLESEYSDKVTEVMNDMTMTQEEKAVKLDELTAYYGEKLRYYTDEAALWQENSTRLYEEDWQWFAKMTGYKVSEAEKWQDTWEETILSVQTGFQSLEEYRNAHEANAASMVMAADEALGEHQENTEAAMNEAGSSTATFAEETQELLDAIAKSSDEASTSVQSMADKAQAAITSVKDSILTWENQYSDSVEKMLADNDALIQSFNDLFAAWSGEEAMSTPVLSHQAVSQNLPTEGFDTGGYTGAWGNSGRLAMLHEKELVLNKEDTENFLSAVGLIRQISQAIDLNALTQSQGFGTSIGAVSASANQVLQQEVTVHAEFPNVTDRNQIEEAFSDIINLASQYANRK